MFPNYHKHQEYLNAKNQYDKLTRTQVTEQEFTKLLQENGQTPEQAQQQTKIAKILGSEIRIGNQMISIKTTE